MLEIEGVSKRFGGIVAVRDVTLRLGSRPVTGLIGPNGAGKTTLFNLIAGTFRPTEGRIRLAGEDITRLPAHARFDRGLVRTFQIPHEFGKLTVLENLMVVPAGQPGERLFDTWFRPARTRAREAEIRDRARETLAFLKLDRLAGDRAETLSGGQKKLLELGRAMMAAPKLVLLDEPGAGVNPTLLAELASMIETLADRGYRFCIIEHNMDMIARLCDPVVVMAEGAVLTEGSIAAVRADPRVVEAYLGSAA
ncbi:MAG: ABC transporter ATP-binding protein [Paracoccaceae bacterium]